MAKTNTTKETLVGKRFQRTGKEVFITVETEDTVRKTVIVRTEDGKTQALSTSTLKDKRKWIEAEVEQEVTKVDTIVEVEPVTEVTTLPTEIVTKQTTDTKNLRTKQSLLIYQL